MARISGVDIPNNKKLRISLTYLYGIGHTTADQICDAAGVDGNVRVRELSEDDIAKVRRVIETSHRIEGELRQEVRMNIKRLMDIGCYRGLRHRRGLPVRGQRTHTNARTRKGRKKNTIGAKRK